MTKGEALAKVAGYVAGNVAAGDLEDVTGLSQPEQDELSDADLDRLEWAKDQVVRRLFRMGSQREQD